MNYVIQLTASQTTNLPGTITPTEDQISKLEAVFPGWDSENDDLYIDDVDHIGDCALVSLTYLTGDLHSTQIPDVLVMPRMFS